MLFANGGACSVYIVTVAKLLKDLGPGIDLRLYMVMFGVGNNKFYYKIEN